MPFATQSFVRLGQAAAMAALLTTAIQAPAAQPTWLAPLSTQCKLALDPQWDAQAKPYVQGLAALRESGPAWLPSVCAEAGKSMGEEGMYRVKAMLAAHLLHQVNEHGPLNAEQRRAVGQAIGVAQNKLAKQEQAVEMVYADARTQAAYGGMSADGLAYGMKDTAPAVAKTLDGFAERFGP